MRLMPKPSRSGSELTAVTPAEYDELDHDLAGEQDQPWLGCPDVKIMLKTNRQPWALVIDLHLSSIKAYSRNFD
jgi:hypothetical protein